MTLVINITLHDLLITVMFIVGLFGILTMRSR